MYASDGGGGLFLTPIPVPPGDPAALTQAAGTYTAAQGAVSRDHATLASAASQAYGTAWQGTGAAGYVTATRDLVATYALTASALARGASTLRTYAADLTAAQATARQANAAVATSNAAAAKLLTAQGAAERSQAAATTAAQTSTTADATAAASPHSPSAQVAADHAKTAAGDAQSAADSDQRQLTALSSAWDSDYNRAVTLCARAQEQASQAATRAATGFSAASTGLMGKSPKPVRGNAQGVDGGSPWQDLIDRLADYNDKAGWGLNAWGAFGAVVLTKSEVVYLEAQADLGRKVGTFDDAVEAVMADKGFFSSNYYSAVDDLSGAFRARRAANADLLEAIRPAGNDWGAMGVLGKAGLGLGMASDVVTLAAPTPSFGPDGLLGGNTDRGMAAANLAASGLALGSTMDIGLASAAMAIPGVDVVVGAVLVGTAAYFAGEYVYQHWGTISHGVEDAGNWVGHDATSLVGDAGHDIKKAFSWL
jgi:hypothetical protein